MAEDIVKTENRLSNSIAIEELQEEAFEIEVILFFGEEHSAFPRPITRGTPTSVFLDFNLLWFICKGFQLPAVAMLCL